MQAFMDQDFLLESATAKTLFHEYAEGKPIVDFHNHLSPADIAQRRRFEDLTQLWLERDHYKWRAMRACGVEEKYITGDAGAYEKFFKWAEVVPQLIGCPLYHWTHLELQRYFDIYEPLTPDSAADIWERAKEALQTYDAVSMLERQNVKALCTTDDPADTLEWHKKIREDDSIPFQVLPTFRPDKYLDMEAPDFSANAKRLGDSVGISVNDLPSLKEALHLALERFAALGCRVSDHSFSRFRYSPGTAQAELLCFLGREYKAHGIVMQLHLGPIRNQSPRLFETLGPDAGGDSVGLPTDPFQLGRFLGDLEREGALPNAILYNLNPADTAVLSSMAVNFAPKVQYGAAWWFNDTLRGMRRQIQELMENGMLAKNVGMLTDSRSFSSFVRHEYYRRILCNELGEQIERGTYAGSPGALKQMLADVCWKNAEAFFQLSDAV